MPSPWLDIPLADYEGHMALPGIGQAEMLAAEFGAVLRELAPPSVAVVGCAGGNGFERISPQTTRRVVGIDLNPVYLETLSSRYAHSLPGLELYETDIDAPAITIAPVDLIYAALLFEYVRLGPALQNLKALCRPGGLLVSVLQLPSVAIPEVSPSPFNTLQSLAAVVRLVTPSDLEANAASAGFALLSSRVVRLQSGKEFLVQRFQLSPAADPPVEGTSE